MNAQLIDRMRGCLLGLAVGDAVGTTVEFKRRGSFAPVTDMVGGGPFGLEPGQWTDDTSMALCLAESLVEKKTFDSRDQMQRYTRWYREGYLSSTGECFDIGNTTVTALRRFEETGDPFAGTANPDGKGNGSLMRLAPVPMFFYPDMETAVKRAGESSLTTHGAVECVDACRLYGRMLVLALDGRAKEEILFGNATAKIRHVPKIQAIAAGHYRDKPVSQIRGTGYVVDSLEAALWCFHNTDNFRDAILAAVNLGDDADTTAAVCGQLAGAYYGKSGIPAAWVDKLYMREKIQALADRLREREP